MDIMVAQWMPNVDAILLVKSQFVGSPVHVHETA